MSSGYSYLHLGEKINSDNYLIAKFYLESDANFLETAEAIAGESSIGTWTTLSTMTSTIYSELAPKIFSVDSKKGIIKIAYPIALWEKGNVAQILSGIAGNIFGMKSVKNLRLLDVDFPDKMLNDFDGPAFGIKGIRDAIEVYDRPLVGTIIKPKCGLPPKMHARVAYESWVGGCDIVKDDENLTNQEFNPFEERVIETMKLKKEAEEKTGKKKIYVVNISAQADKMLKRAKFVKKHGGKCVMMDIMTVGFSGVQYIRSQNLGLILHGHRAMHAALTKNPRHGVSMLVIAKMARVAGIDQLHTGTVVGKMDGTEEMVKHIDGVMRGYWSGIKTVMPIASGGLHPGHVPALMEILGDDMIMNFGGGIHGHPHGSLEGAKAVMQALEATKAGLSLHQVTKGSANRALADAIKKWGVYVKDSKKVKKYTYNFDLLVPPIYADDEKIAVK